MKFFRRAWSVIALAGRLTWVNMQLLYGAWYVFGLKQPIVSIFGGSRLALTDPYARKAHELAGRFVNEGISVVTGGGPGIMEAASCGAVAKGPGKGRSIGIGVKDLGEGRNPCVQMYFELNHFYTRKWLLTHYSDAFVIFPGGFGTLDELTEVLTLFSTKRLSKVPIVLVGREYWASFIEWVNNEAIQHGLITQEQCDLFLVTDDLERAFCVVRDECALKKAEQEL